MRIKNCLAMALLLITFPSWGEFSIHQCGTSTIDTFYTNAFDTLFIGDECVTTTTHKKTLIYREGSTTLYRGYFQLGDTHLYEGSKLELDASHSGAGTVHLGRNSLLSISRSTFSTKETVWLKQSSTLQLQHSHAALNGSVQLNTNTRFNLTDQAELIIKHQINLHVSSRSGLRVFHIDPTSRLIFENSPQLKVTVSPRIYLPQSKAYSLFEFDGDFQRTQGKLVLKDSDTPSRKLNLSQYSGKLRRKKSATSYSEGCFSWTCNYLAGELDNMIPLAEADPNGPEAQTLAYFDSLKDVNNYEMAVFEYNLRHCASRPYPDCKKFLVNPNLSSLLILLTDVSMLFLVKVFLPSQYKLYSLYQPPN